MENRKRSLKPPGPFVARLSRPLDDVTDARPQQIDWPAWLRIIERKRRLLSRMQIRSHRLLPSHYFAAATFISFQLEGIDVSENEIAHALARGVAGRVCRSRNDRRLRNHVAILHKIEKSLRLNETLKISTVVRWYTSISSGLSSASLDDNSMARLDQVVRRINSPQFRLQPAVGEVVRTHIQLLSDAIVPGFNGILCRFLLRYHLGRCGLPGVLFDPINDRSLMSDESRLLPRILEQVDASFDMLLGLQ